MPLVLGRVHVSRLDFVRSGKHVLAKRGMMSSYSTEISTRHSRGIQCSDKSSRFQDREFIGLANQLGYGKQYQKQILAIGAANVTELSVMYPPEVILWRIFS